LKNLYLSLFILLTLCLLLACTENIDDELALSRTVSKQLGTQLKSRLTNAIQTAGPEGAISVCNSEAISIATVVSKNHDLEVGRTSLKIRNVKNQADSWETAQLHKFAMQTDTNVKLNTLETHEIVSENGKKIFRYMKAIPMQEPCLLCHGSSIAPTIEEKIKTLYPQDQANGYELGEIRGAFSVKITL